MFHRIEVNTTSYILPKKTFITTTLHDRMVTLHYTMINFSYTMITSKTETRIIRYALGETFGRNRHGVRLHSVKHIENGQMGIKFKVG